MASHVCCPYLLVDLLCDQAVSGFLRLYAHAFPCAKPVYAFKRSVCVISHEFFPSSGLFFQRVLVASYSFLLTIINNLVPHSTFNSLVAGFIPSSSSQSMPTSSANPAAILPSVANVSLVVTSAMSTTVISPSTALLLFSQMASQQL